MSAELEIIDQTKLIQDNCSGARQRLSPEPILALERV
jgi:hypothetical protein